MKLIDPIESLQELLEAGLPRATEPSVAKIQLAGLYYVTKALRAAKAAQVLIGGGYLFESFLLIRSLYNATVDFLWLCQDPEPRAECFYDSTAVTLETQYNRYKNFGAGFSRAIDTLAEINKRHYQTAHEKFRNKGGKLRDSWAHGNIRNRADDLASKDPKFKVLAEAYEWLYKTLSDYEHSAPVLAFQYLHFSPSTVHGRNTDNVGADLASKMGQLLGVLVGLMIEAACSLKVISKDMLRFGQQESKEGGS